MPAAAQSDGLNVEVRVEAPKIVGIAGDDHGAFPSGDDDASPYTGANRGARAPEV